MDIYLSAAAILISLVVQALIFSYLLFHTKKAGPKPEVVYPFAEKKIFVTFPCINCSQSIVIYDIVSPGEVAVVNCDYCETSHTIHSPFLRIHKTKELPETIKSAVAAHFANGGT